MSIRLDPRRLGVLKQLAAEANSRPGDLVRIWVEERLDAEKRGQSTVSGGGADLAGLVAALTQRVAALEQSSRGEPSTTEVEAGNAKDKASANGDKPKRRARTRTKVTAKPSAERVALHDEIIAVLTERGPLPAADIATAILERGRYVPPRSGKPLDAATVNARISNPTYRARFTRSEGRIGLAEG